MEENDKFYTYNRRAMYYETDAMGIVHHSNYIRWFEEIRTDFLAAKGFPYAKMEELGVLIPVLSVECQYKTPVKFEEDVLITSYISQFGGARFEITYKITGVKDGALKVTGKTTHCFVTKDFRPIRVKTQFPDIYKVFSDNYFSSGE